jgi:hypothetical protein
MKWVLSLIHINIPNQCSKIDMTGSLENFWELNRAGAFEADPFPTHMNPPAMLDS